VAGVNELDIDGDLLPITSVYSWQQQVVNFQVVFRSNQSFFFSYHHAQFLLFALECNCTQSLSKKTFFINQQTSNIELVQY
jgi:hypothetical protein